jgi:signal transduction histidine kinase
VKSLYLRIYATMLAALLLFALVAGWLAQNHLDQERLRVQTAFGERMNAWGELIENSLPPASAPVDEQKRALLDWSQRLRMPLALDDAEGRRIATSELFERAERDPEGRRGVRVALRDGRSLWVARGGPRLGPPPGGPGGRGMGGPGGPGEAGGVNGPGGPGSPGPELRRPRLPLPGPEAALALHVGGRPLFVGGLGLVAALVVLFLAVAIGAFPVVRRLTRRLETLQRGVETFGAGQLDHRVSEEGRDEVAALAQSFNRAAERIEQLLRSHQSLLANASHELRSPLARLKMAVAMLDEAPPEHKERLRREIHTNIGELDALVEEVLLASRLDAAQQLDRRDPVDLVAVVAEEAARTGASLEADPAMPTVRGDERLLRRAVRNLLENARRYGGSEVQAQLRRTHGAVEVRICDRGPGVPSEMRSRIFEPFFRLPGHAEQAGGVGLGLSLVKQIAERHGGSVSCEAREGGGSTFTLRLPA